MRKLILMSALIIAIMSGTSHADFVYVTSNGTMGSIHLVGTSIDLPVTRYTGSWSDPLIGSFLIGSTSYVMVVDRTHDTSLDTFDTATIFSASNLTQPTERGTFSLPYVYNTKSFGGSSNGRSVFFASRGNVSIVEFSTSDFSEMKNSYTYVNLSDDIEPELVTMSVGSYYIYTLFRLNPSRLEMMAFDGQLRDDIKDFHSGYVRNDAYIVEPLSGNRFALGGTEGISLFNYNTMSTALSTDFEVTSICRDDGNGFYFTVLRESGGMYYSDLVHYIDSSRPAVAVTYMVEGSDCQLVRDEDNHVLAMKVDENVYFYDIAGNKDEYITAYGASDLGGALLNMTTAKAQNNDTSSSNSNCDVSGVGAVLLGLCLLTMSRKR